MNDQPTEITAIFVIFVFVRFKAHINFKWKTLDMNKIPEHSLLE